MIKNSFFNNSLMNLSKKFVFAWAFASIVLFFVTFIFSPNGTSDVSLSHVLLMAIPASLIISFFHHFLGNRKS